VPINQPLCNIINNRNNNKPVIVGATGIVTKGFRKILEDIPGKYSIDSLQKTAVLGTSHIIRKVLLSETGSLRGGDYHLFKRS
jgi:hypothetical protein